MVSVSTQKSDSLEPKRKMSEFEVSESPRNERNSIKKLPEDEPFSEYTELLTKFLSSVMMKDYEMALKYCTQILKNDPSNTTAQEFYPLIVKKLEMDLDDSSSESSDMYSSSSSRSSETSTSEQCNINENPDNKTSLVAKKNNLSFGTNVKDDCDSDVKRTNTKQQNPETMKFNLESIKRPQIRTHSPLKSEAKQKQNTTMKKNKIIAKNVKEEKRKDLDKSHIAVRGQASKILLHPTKTTILSKEV